MLDKRGFAEYIKDHIKEYLPPSYADAEIEVREVTKMNDEVRTGISLMRDGESISPNIYLDQMYEDYRKGADIDGIVGQVADLRIEHAAENISVEGLKDKLLGDYADLKGSIHGRLVDPELNTKTLKELVSRPCGEFALTYQVDLGPMNDALDTHAIVRVSEPLLKRWGITEEELYHDVMEADKAREPGLFDMQEMMATLFDRNNPAANYLTGERDIRTSPGLIPFYVLTYRDRELGASLMAHEDVLAKIGEVLGGNYFVVPSSIQELLIMREEDGDARMLTQMCRDVNETEVSQEELLSDKVQHYDAAERKLENAIAWQTARERAAEKGGRKSVLEGLQEKRMAAGEHRQAVPAVRENRPDVSL